MVRRNSILLYIPVHFLGGWLSSLWEVDIHTRLYKPHTLHYPPFTTVCRCVCIIIINIIIRLPYSHYHHRRVSDHQCDNDFYGAKNIVSIISALIFLPGISFGERKAIKAVSEPTPKLLHILRLPGTGNVDDIFFVPEI